MGLPIARNTGAQLSGSVQNGQLAVGVSASNYGANAPGGLTYYNSVTPPINGLTIVSSSAVPPNWIINDLSNSTEVLNVINGLPDRVGQTRFTDTGSALAWLTGSTGYITLNEGNVSVPKYLYGSNLKIHYDASLPTASANTQGFNTTDTTTGLTTISYVPDLSGNGKHLTQTTKINQPSYIPNSQNGRAANYNTGGQWFDADATVMYSPYPGLTTGARSFFIVLKGTPWSAFSWDRGGGVPGSLQLGYNGIIGWNDLGQDIGGIGIGGGNSTTTYIMSYLFDTTQTLMYRNGNLNRAQTSNTFTLNGGSFGCWTTAPSAGNSEGYWYELIFLNKIPTINEYNTTVSYLGNKWGVSYGLLTNYN